MVVSNFTSSIYIFCKQKDVKMNANKTTWVIVFCYEYRYFFITRIHICERHEIPSLVTKYIMTLKHLRIVCVTGIKYLENIYFLVNNNLVFTHVVIQCHYKQIKCDNNEKN